MIILHPAEHRAEQAPRHDRDLRPLPAAVTATAADCESAAPPPATLYRWVQTRQLFQYLAHDWTLEHSSLIYDSHLIMKAEP